jgi:hypothetical protein
MMPKAKLFELLLIAAGRYLVCLRKYTIPAETNEIRTSETPVSVD